MRGKIPVTLLTGFLGSGKTTLLSRLLAQPDFSDTAVIINEFGEISIDHLVVADLAENIIELRDGCLCCSIRGDLVMTLRDLHRKRCLDDIPQFSRVIVETTGLADPIPLIHTLMANQPLMSVYALDAVVTTVDGLNGLKTLDEHSTASNQAALADILVVTKTDCTPAPMLATLRGYLREINPGAELHESQHGDIAAMTLMQRGLFQPTADDGTLSQWLSAEQIQPHDHSTEYTVHIIRHDGLLSLAGTSVFLNRVVNEFSEDILRIKGLAGFTSKDGKPALLHAVQNKFYPLLWLAHWPDDDHSARLVFIGRHLDTARLDELFASLCV